MDGFQGGRATLDALQARADERFELLRDATVLQLQRRRHAYELEGLAAKIRQNKDVLNELRFGPLRDAQKGGAGPNGTAFWVETGAGLAALERREVESLVMQNQMAVKALADEVEQRLAEIDGVLGCRVDQIADINRQWGI